MIVPKRIPGSFTNGIAERVFGNLYVFLKETVNCRRTHKYQVLKSVQLYAFTIGFCFIQFDYRSVTMLVQLPFYRSKVTTEINIVG